jgi:hypothetical protein
MKNIKLVSTTLSLITVFSFSIFNACSSDSDNSLEEKVNQISTIKTTDKEALLFMLEEEKLARDTYEYLDDLWSINQFSNIKKSEQNHMDAVANLLDKNDISYTILPYGEFTNDKLQKLYDQFKTEGVKSKSLALQIGATIEDLDIVDLKQFISETTNLAIIEVFNSLMCGSQNHLRSFVKGINNNGDLYTPKYLNQEEYTSIISSTNQTCN